MFEGSVEQMSTNPQNSKVVHINCPGQSRYSSPTDIGYVRSQPLGCRTRGNDNKYGDEDKGDS